MTDYVPSYGAPPTPEQQWAANTEKDIHKQIAPYVDSDNDGAVMDDIFSYGAKTAVGIGTTALGAFGGPAGAAAGAAVGAALSPVAGFVGNWAGDTLEDLCGTRQKVDPSKTTDPAYQPGAPPTMGQQARAQGFDVPKAVVNSDDGSAAAGPFDGMY